MPSRRQQPRPASQASLAKRPATGAGAEIATMPKIARQIDPDPSLRDAFDAGVALGRMHGDGIYELSTNVGLVPIDVTVAVLVVATTAVAVRCCDCRCR